MLIHTCTPLTKICIFLTDNTQKTALDNSKNPYTQDISIQKCKAKVAGLS